MRKTKYIIKNGIDDLSYETIQFSDYTILKIETKIFGRSDTIIPEKLINRLFRK